MHVNNSNLGNTYTQAIPRTGISMILVLVGMFKPQIRNMGKIANVKSVMIAHALYRKVRAIITSIGTQ
jgi:hypothetical protein